MSRRCSICGKKSMVAVVRKKLRGKYNPTCKKKKYPNLQWVTLPVGKRIKACTKCIRTLNKHKLSKEKKVKTEKETLPQPAKEVKKPVSKEKEVKKKIVGGKTKLVQGSKSKKRGVA